MLTAQDIHGLYAIIPTPAKSGAERFDATDTVDVDETVRLIDALIRDGATGIIVLGNHRFEEVQIVLFQLGDSSIQPPIVF